MKVDVIVMCAAPVSWVGGPEVDTIAQACHGNGPRDWRAVVSIAPFAWRRCRG
jgi:hypothetical protein